MTRRSPAERFATKYTVSETGCWLWTGCLHRKGYGEFWDGSGNVYAHRYSYELHRAQIPVGLVIDHLCRVRNCVNPSHLEPVTGRENLLRGDNVFAARAKQTHCKRGHPLSGENLVASHATRECRTCKRAFGHSARSA